MRKTTISLITLLSLMLLMFSGAAFAHVSVLPKETTQGTYEKFTVRVPSEKESPTVKVEVKFPVDAVSISRFEPKPGWKYEVAKAAQGAITGVTWTAEGSGLSSTEFGDFSMQGKVADAATAITWKAYQTYKDGTVVEWTGASDSKTPASVTTVKAKPATAATDSHGNSHGDSDGASTASHPAAEASGSEAGESQTPLYLSIAAVILGGASLVVSLLKKSR